MQLPSSETADSAAVYTAYENADKKVAAFAV
jgi:hypothetical protein